jgi:hypothetical protein
MNPAFHQAMVPNGAMMPVMQQQPQQPLSSPFNLNAAGIMQMYQAHHSQATGWKADVAPQERLGYLNELYVPAHRLRPTAGPLTPFRFTSLKLARGGIGAAADQNSWSQAISLEGNTYNKANSKVTPFLPRSSRAAL